MNEYIERETLIAWLENMHVSKNIINAIQNKKRFPTADVVEVTRCKDCQYSYWKDESDTSSAFMCGNPNGLYDEIDFNDFCSYCLRKEGLKIEGKGD